MNDTKVVSPSGLRCRVFLIGGGVVGRAILNAHLDAGVSVCLVDQDESCLRQAVSGRNLDPADWDVRTAVRFASGATAIEMIHRKHAVRPGPTIIIESIAERLDLKRAFFAEAESLFDDAAVLCSNTSTLRIGDIAADLSAPERFCGLHFFMPVDCRAAVEVVRGPQTGSETIARVCEHAGRIGKQPLVVGDGPGFVVNRLLSPYLNEAMLLLGRGINGRQIERAALEYGMPMSPLELIDWIGTRTVFDAGRVFWQAFPGRIDPSPIAPALLKRKRLGRAAGAGFYDYVDGVRSDELSPRAEEIVTMYQREPVAMDDREVMAMLSIPMLIEAALAIASGVAQSPEQLEMAIKGGLGFDPGQSWLGYFDCLGSETILEQTDRWAEQTSALAMPDWLGEALRNGPPSAAIQGLSKL